MNKERSSRPKYVKCLLPLHLPGPLTYLWPFKEQKPLPGTRVVLPLKKRKITGLIWEEEQHPRHDIKYKEIIQVVDEVPLLTKNLMDFIQWAANYYFYPLGPAVAEALPASFVSARQRATERLEAGRSGPGRSRLEQVDWQDTPIKELTEEQKAALKSVEDGLEGGQFSPFLLFGVTGSGKTLVYIEAAKKCLESGKSSLIMVPEIAMTAQLASRFRNVFGKEVAILHSGLTPAQRRDQWWKLRCGKSRLVLGTRSAIFSPLEDIGLIVVDEEHDASYKQDERFRYNARDLAIVRAKMENAVVLLGSGTPSVASYYNALKGRYRLLTMKNRPQGSSLPAVEIIDRRQKGKKKEKEEISWLSKELKEKIEETLARKEQVLLFLNRRGFATYVFCPECGFTFKCSECDVILTWHRRNKLVMKGRAPEPEGKARSSGVLSCHYCGHQQPAVPVCPQCGGQAVKTSGFGTERVAEDFLQVFPEATVARVDRDTLSSRKKLEAVLRAFRDGKIDCLVGTQMVTKGHDFPNLTLVGILWADMSLNVPEFNAAERTFQLISQVAGRAGRWSKPGKVLIQTYVPQHYSIRCAASHDFEKFFETEMELRQTLMYPPFSRLINIKFSSSRKSTVEKAAFTAKQALERHASKAPESFILGPVPCPKGRIKSRYRFQLLLKGPLPQVRKLADIVDKEVQGLLPGGVRMEIDVDPINFM